MSNHLHVVARTRPDLVKAWSDEEVAFRWWNLFPQRRRKDRSPEEPTEFELNQIRNNGRCHALDERDLSGQHAAHWEFGGILCD
jgi:hypothetical protein